MENKIIVYSDGASRGNPGVSGWAAIIFYKDRVVELAGAKKLATNNQMELEAVIAGLDFAKKHFKKQTVELHADSRYVLNGIDSWLDGWQRNGWITTSKKPVENKEYWLRLLKLRDHFGPNLKLKKVLGHSGHIYNDRCDELAVSSALGKSVSLFTGKADEYESLLRDSKPKSDQKHKPIDSSRKNKERAYSYVSLVDGRVWVDKDWADCEKRVKGKKAKYKKVFSKKEETDLIQNYTLESLL